MTFGPMGVFGLFPMWTWPVKLSQATSSLLLVSQDLLVWLHVLLSLTRMTLCLVGWFGLYTVNSSLSRWVYLFWDIFTNTWHTHALIFLLPSCRAAAAKVILRISKLPRKGEPRLQSSRREWPHLRSGEPGHRVEPGGPHDRSIWERWAGSQTRAEIWWWYTAARACVKKPLRRRPRCTVQQRPCHGRACAWRPKARSGAREWPRPKEVRAAARSRCSRSHVAVLWREERERGRRRGADRWDQHHVRHPRRGRSPWRWRSRAGGERGSGHPPLRGRRRQRHRVDGAVRRQLRRQPHHLLLS